MATSVHRLTIWSLVALQQLIQLVFAQTDGDGAPPAGGEAPAGAETPPQAPPSSASPDSMPDVRNEGPISPVVAILLLLFFLLAALVAYIYWAYSQRSGGKKKNVGKKKLRKLNMKQRSQYRE